MKDTYYFSHDYDTTSDPKIQALLGEYGATGYGIYWTIVEMLHKYKEHKLPMKEYVYLAIAKQMLTSAQQILAIINFAISPCELFVSDGDFFWSNRVNDNISRMEEISQKRSLAGKASASVKHLSTKSNKIKENKIKENINNIYTADFLTFWNKYPKKSGSKKAAFENFKKLNIDAAGLNIILSAIDKQIAWRQSARDGDFRPEWKDPERWIKNRMWEAELSTQEKQASW